MKLPDNLLQEIDLSSCFKFIILLPDLVEATKSDVLTMNPLPEVLAIR